MTDQIPNCPQPETPIRERAWTDGQIEAMHKDAERYRAMRRAALTNDDAFLDSFPGDDYVPTEAEFDAAIDNAMAATTVSTP